MERASTKDRARGRWKEILQQFGVDQKFLTKKHGPCPICGGKDRFSFDDRYGCGDYICRGCGAGDGFILAMKITGAEFKEVAKRVDALLGDAPVLKQPTSMRVSAPDRNAMRKLWAKSTPIEDEDPVAKYLISRGIDYAPAALRCAMLRHKSDGKLYPVMLALFSHPNGDGATLHKTFLTREGGKADLELVRQFMPGSIAKGGAVRLFPFAHVLGIAEGIETALSASQIHGVPCWAALNTSLLRAWEPPRGVKRVVVFADNDVNYAGHAAAYDLAHRLVSVKKISTEVRMPKTLGADWNDELKRKAI